MPLSDDATVSFATPTGDRAPARGCPDRDRKPLVLTLARHRQTRVPASNGSRPARRTQMNVRRYAGYGAPLESARSARRVIRGERPVRRTTRGSKDVSSRACLTLGAPGRRCAHRNTAAGAVRLRVDVGSRAYGLRRSDRSRAVSLALMVEAVAVAASSPSVAVSQIVRHREKTGGRPKRSRTSGEGG